MARAQLKLAARDGAPPPVEPGESLEASWLLHGGIPLTLRAARPDDAPALQALVRGLSPRSRYRRFFNPLRELPPELLASFTRAEPAGHMTLVALAGGIGAQTPVAMGQYVADDDMLRGEFALLVADAWQGHGIGGRLLRRLISIAAAAGLATIEGDVLDENQPMRRLLQRHDFEFLPHPDGAYMFKARKQLEPAPWKCQELWTGMNGRRAPVWASAPCEKK